MATTVSFFTAQQAADRLGITEGRVRQLCWDMVPRDQKHGPNWLLTDGDIERMAARSDGRKKSAKRT